MKQKELAKTLRGIKELLGWQMTLVCNVLSKLDQSEDRTSMSKDAPHGDTPGSDQARE